MEGLEYFLVYGLVAMVLLVLAMLLPWFVFRIASHTKQTRDQLKEVNKSLKLLLDK